MSSKFLQLQPLKLAGSGITATATSIIVDSCAFPDGTLVTSSELGTTNYGTLEPNTAREEIFSFTGITQNADGTATLTGVTRGLQFGSPYTADTALRQSHAGGTTVVVSNNPQMYEDLISFDNDETVTGEFTFPAGGDTNAPKSGTSYSAPTNDLEYASKKYIDNIAIAGSPDMTTTVKGIAEEATQAEIDADTAIGGTGARLALNPSTLATSKYGTRLPSADEKDALAGESGTPSSSNTYLTEDSIATSDTNDKVPQQTSDKKVVWIDEAAVAGDMAYFDGSNWQDLSVGNEGESLKQGASDTPEWDVNLKPGIDDTSSWYTFQVPFSAVPGSTGYLKGWETVNSATWTINSMAFLGMSNASNLAVTRIPSRSAYYSYVEDIIVEAPIRISPGSSQMGFGFTNNTNAGLQATDRGFQYIETGGSYYLRTANGATATDTAITGINSGNLHMIKMVYEVGVSVKLYVDGVLKATNTTNLPSGATAYLAISAGAVTSGLYYIGIPTVSVKLN